MIILYNIINIRIDAIEMEVLGLYQDALSIYSKTLENLNQVTDEYEVNNNTKLYKQLYN